MGRNEAILVVDDSVPVLHLVRSILQGEGFDVLTAESGEQALDIAQSRDLDLVVLDGMMPGMSGFEACAELRDLARHRTTPVLFLTGLTDLRTYQQAVDVGGDDLIGKPINRTGLLIRVRSLLRLAELRSARDLHVTELQAQVETLLRDLRPAKSVLQGCVARLRDESDGGADVLERVVEGLAELEAATGGAPPVG